MVFVLLCMSLAINVCADDQTKSFYDYSSFIGLWEKIDPDGLNGDIYLYINEVIDNKIVKFSVDEGEVIEGVIENNQIKWSEQWYDGEMGLTLTFNDDSIHLKYSRYSMEWYDEILFISRTVKPRKITQGDYTVLLNGEKLEFDQPPMIVNDRVMVPMRAIFEAFNAAVFFQSTEIDGTYIDAFTEQVNLSMYSTAAGGKGEWQILRNTPDGGTESIPFDVAPFIYNDRTLVPVRVVSETLGADVKWDSSTNTVIINGEIHNKWKSDEEIEKMKNVNWQEASKTADEWMQANGYTYLPMHIFYGYNFDGRWMNTDIINTDGDVYTIIIYYNGKFDVYKLEGNY